MIYDGDGYILKDIFLKMPNRYEENPPSVDDEFFYNRDNFLFVGILFGVGNHTIKKLGIINTIPCEYYTPEDNPGGEPQ